MTTNTLAVQDLKNIASISTEDLKAELAKALQITAEHIWRLALIWRELERRGEDLSHLRSGLGAYLAPVAYGRLLPEAVVRLAGNRTALKAVALLAPDEQRRVLDEGHIAVKRTDDAPVNVPITALTPTDVSRAIDTVRGTIRPVSEQQIARRRQRSLQDRPHTLAIKLTEAEYREVQSRARRLNISASKLIYDAVKDSGYLTP